jgi:lipoprotein signal peptidase
MTDRIPRTRRAALVPFLLSFACILAGDQVSKAYLFSQPITAVGWPASPGPVAGWPSWIDRSYNQGVAWGIGHHFPAAVALLTVVLIPILAVVWWQVFRHQGWLANLAFGAVLGGAIGNGIDRLLSLGGHLAGVRDFIMVDLHGVGIPYVWPTFNIADAGISVGVMVLALLSLRRPALPPRPHPHPTI